MRKLMASFVIMFGLCAVCSVSAQENDLEDRLAVLPGEKVLGSLPSRSVIAANLVRGDKWYALGAPEIHAVSKVVNQERQFVPEGVLFPILPLLLDRIVLWGMADGKLVALEVLALDDSATLLGVRDDKGGWYPVADGEERRCLQRLIKRIQDGKERPVAEAQAQEDKPSEEPPANSPKQAD